MGRMRRRRLDTFRVYAYLFEVRSEIKQKEKRVNEWNASASVDTCRTTTLLLSEITFEHFANQ